MKETEDKIIIFNNDIENKSSIKPNVNIWDAILKPMNSINSPIHINIMFLKDISKKLFKKNTL